MFVGFGGRRTNRSRRCSNGSSPWRLADATRLRSTAARLPPSLLPKKSQLRRPTQKPAKRVLGDVVVDLEGAVFDVPIEGVPLRQGVLDRLRDRALRQHGVGLLFEPALEAIEPSPVRWTPESEWDDQ